MGFIKKIWVDRSTEFPNRRTQTAVAGQADTYDYTRAEGTVFAEGTKPDATNLNDLEDRIESAFNNVDDLITALTGTVLWTNSAPNSSFSAQTVTLSESISNFAYYELEYEHGASSGTTSMYTTGKIPVTAKTNFALVTSSSTPYFREITSVPSGTSVKFGSCAQGDANVVPYRIIGYVAK